MMRLLSFYLFVPLLLLGAGNVREGVGSIGTTIAPLFGAHFILTPVLATSGSEAVRVPYLFIGAGLILIALLVSCLSLPSLDLRGEATGEASRKSIFSFRKLRFGFVAIFMYVGAEVSIGTFLTSYVSDKLQVSDADANEFVAFYWGSMFIGRLIGSFVLKHWRPSYMLFLMSFLATILIGVSVFTSGYTAVWSMVAVGLCNSIMFAVIFSLSITGLGKYTSQASGILTTAIAGGAIISFLQGILKDNYSWKIAFLIPLVCYCYITFYAYTNLKPNDNI